MAAGKNESKAAWEEREQLHHVNQMKRGFRKAFKHQAEAARNIAIYEHLVIENVER
jgi:hypothetical protein